jgi:hypothetical protein
MLLKKFNCGELDRVKRPALLDSRAAAFRLPRDNGVGFSDGAAFVAGSL